MTNERIHNDEMKVNPSQLDAWDGHYHWHAFTQMAEYEPLVIERAEGVWLFDVHGNRYLDGVSSLWCNLHGHQHPKIKAAIRDQLDRVAHNTSLGMGNSTTTLLAKRLAEITPGNLEHVFFASDGSSAVESALKMAFQYWRQCDTPRPEKTKYLALGNAYHGDTLGSASVGGIARFHAMFSPLLFEVIRLPSPDPRRLPADQPTENAAEYYLSQLEQVLADRHEEIAAMVLEPLVQGAAGMIFHPPGYLAGVRELTRKYDVLLITDEIVTGFGRLGTMFACDQEQVVPDFLCLGKSITGGYLPLSAAITNADIYAAFLGTSASGRSFMHGHTYAGNPLAAAAALATLEILEEEKTLERLAPQCEQLAQILATLSAHPHVAETRQKGMLAAVELTPGEPQSRFPEDQRIGYQVCREALRHEVWLRPLGDVLVIMPPLSTSTEELKFLGDALLQSIDVVTREFAKDQAAVHSQ